MIARANRLILPIGLPLVMLFGVFLPAPGAALDQARPLGISVSDLCVLTIFFVNGLNMRLSGTRDRQLLRALLLVLGINLILAPLLAAGVIMSVDITLGVLLGMALMASVPTTLSSGAVIAINAGGDRVWALALTVVTVLIGSVTAPLAISALLSTAVSINPWPLLLDTAVMVLVPTAAGWLVRRTIWPKQPAWLGLVPSAAVLTVVWMTMSTYADEARAMSLALIGLMVLVGAVGHGVLLGASSLASRGMPHRQAMPVLFIGSQKTLPLALTMLVLVIEAVPALAVAASVATITCVIWHFIQVFADSLLGNRLAIRAATSRPAPTAG